MHPFIKDYLAGRKIAPKGIEREYLRFRNNEILACTLGAVYLGMAPVEHLQPGYDTDPSYDGLIYRTLIEAYPWLTSIPPQEYEFCDGELFFMNWEVIAHYNDFHFLEEEKIIEWLEEFLRAVGR